MLLKIKNYYILGSSAQFYFVTVICNVLKLYGFADLHENKIISKFKKKRKS